MLVLLLLVVGGRVELLVLFSMTPIPNTAKPLAVPQGDSPTSEALLHGLLLVRAAGGRLCSLYRSSLLGLLYLRWWRVLNMHF